MNTSAEESDTKIDKDGLGLRLGVLLPKHEYLLAISTTIIALIAISGR